MGLVPRIISRSVLKKRKATDGLKPYQKSNLRCLKVLRVIFLSDRESDIYEFFVEAGETPFVIRAAQDRCVDASVGKLSELVRCQEVAGAFQTEVARRGNQPAREATVNVRFTIATLCPPRHRASGSETLPTIEVSVVWVLETDPPDGVKPWNGCSLQMSKFRPSLMRFNA